MANQVTKSILVEANVGDVYKLWADFTNFPEFMKNIKSVRMIGDRTSKWQLEGPLGTTIEWEAQTTRMEENKRIAWNSKDLEGTIKTSGEVTFNALPQNRTEVTATVQYVPPAGMAGEVVAKLFSNPEEQLEEDLRNFKKFCEGMHERLTTRS